MKYKLLSVCLSTFLCLTQILNAIPTTYDSYAIQSTQLSGDLCPSNLPYHLLVNKTYGLPKDFVPAQLVVPDVPFSFDGFHEKRQLDPIAADALVLLFEQATKDGIVLRAVSGYRSYDRQASLYNNYVARDGVLLADTYSAKPGHSEHQTGLAIDVSTPSINNSLTTSLGQTKEGIWLRDNAHTYGFIIRYPEGKESITGYQYEPWHLRYVGTELAATLYTSDLTLEEISSCCPPVVVPPEEVILEEVILEEMIPDKESTPLILASSFSNQFIVSSTIVHPLNQPLFIMDRLLKMLHLALQITSE